MQIQLEGIITPIVTPITSDEKFNEPPYRKHIDFLVQNGISGVFPLGTSGEFYAFDPDEYKRILEATVDAVDGRVTVYAGANHITTRGVIRYAKIAKEAGADALSVLTPMFISQTQDEIFEYYKVISEEVDLPIIIYNNRPKTNVNITPETIRKLAEFENIIGVKDSTGDMTNSAEYIRLTRDIPNFNVLMGRDTLIYAGLCYGATGAIASCSNVAPKVAVDIYENFKARRHQEALEAQFSLSKLRIASNMGSFPIVIKEAMQMIGFDCGNCIAPIQPLMTEQRQKLYHVLDEMHLLANNG